MYIHISMYRYICTSTPDVLTGSERCTPCITATSMRKKRWVRVVPDSFLRATEGPICQTGPPLREICCLPRAWVKDITREIPSLVCHLDYKPLLVFHMGGNEAAMHSPRAIKRLQGFEAVGEGIGSTGYFFFSPSSSGSDIRINRWTESINTWLSG